MPVSPKAPPAAWSRTVAHADMDAFYASVEQLDRPELRGKPILVAHPGRRSVVTTASYEARPFGVGSAMPLAKARRLCPQALVVPPRFDRYAAVSAMIMRVFADFSPKVEPLSLDEAFLDMTGAEGLFGPPAEMGTRLKRAVREATGLTVSVGIANSKYVAKVASDLHKPDGLTIVEPSDVLAFLHPLPIRRLWGAGPRTAQILERLGLRTIGDVAHAPIERLQAALGSLGPHLHALSVGDDPRDVESDREIQSIGHEETLEYDVRGIDAVLPLLLRAADRVAERLRANGLVAGGVRVKLKTASFRLMTRQARLETSTCASKPLFATATELLDEFPWDEPLRLVGMAVYDIENDSAPRQGTLFDRETEKRQRDLDRALDSVRARFGDTAVRRANEIDAGSDLARRRDGRPRR
jgi:DNA polymerase IV